MQNDFSKRRTEEDLWKLETQSLPFFRKETRSKELSQIVPAAQLFICFCGVTTEFEAFVIFDDILTVRKVTNPPGIIHIARAADLKNSDYLSVSRYSHAVQAEIAVGNKAIPKDEKQLINYAWHTAALFKLRGYTNLFCPSLSTISWDTVAGVSDNTVKFQMLDDIPRHISFTIELQSISENDAEWVKSYFETALALRSYDNSRRFGLAFNIMYTWNQTTDPRIAIANVWAGLEALFGKRNDSRTTEALVKRITSWLPTTNESEVRNLYAQRCDAVHGRWLKEDEVWYALKKSESLLRYSLTKCIETNTTTLSDWQ